MQRIGIFVGLAVGLGLAVARGEVITREVSYTDGTTAMKGFLADDDAVSGPRPGVPMVHEWWDHNDYAFKNYPGAVHSFTNPGADRAGRKFDLPLACNEAADKASWADLAAFLEEIFAPSVVTR